MQYDYARQTIATIFGIVIGTFTTYYMVDPAPGKASIVIATTAGLALASIAGHSVMWFFDKRKPPRLHHAEQ